ncbi:RND family efflux transporter, MFP subunit [Paracoccus halophilus]|uniref:RND family efflux transporter, MFP subunit n=1 Tax=Paracoccus halophilus TaxID=376733 RepID=A0A099EY14_9RHOB|nr:efflux RND transporter periplasmic adaptor subunit [Paracoccus halophilus]KGJ03340.1 RND transporter [Paracoccus halophilus]SFA58764.1 RND family efflux transporter, MFP subunit [Paracoccus halophilus]
MIRKCRRFIILAILIMMIGPAAMAFHRGTEDVRAAAPPRPIASIIVTDRLAPEHSIPGVIASRIEVEIGFQTLGRVTRRNVDVGSVVRKGDILATLNPEDLQGDVRAARAAVDAAQVELKTAQATADRTRTLVQRNVASTAQLERAERALSAARSALLQAQAELIRAQDAEGFAVMDAPFDGVISAVYVNAGAVVSAGEPVVQLSAQEGLEAVIDLPEGVLKRLRPDDRYQVWSENDPDDLQPATISRIEPIASTTTRTRRVHMALTDQAQFRLGALIRVRRIATGDAAISLPQSALLTTAGKAQVWVVADDGASRTVSRRDVTLAGPAEGGLIGIASGISPGDEVVIRGIHSLTDGQTVGRRVAP